MFEINFMPFLFFFRRSLPKDTENQVSIVSSIMGARGVASGGPSENEFSVSS